MNELMIFEGNVVEVFEFEGKVLFNPKDVGKCLDIKNVNDAIIDFKENQKIKLKNSDIANTDIRKLNNAGENFLTEAGVYKLIFKSRKEEAERFQDWVTDEVLPQIRQTGGYIPVKEEESNEEFLARAFLVAQETLKKKDLLLKQKEQQLQMQKPKVDTYDRFISKEHTLGFRELRKELESSLNIKIKESELKEIMREENLIGKYVKASAYAIRNGYAVTKDIETEYGTKTQDRFTMKTRDLLFNIFEEYNYLEL